MVLGYFHRPRWVDFGRTQSRRFRNGFTLVELLAILVAMAVLIALLLPLVGKSKGQSRRSKCAQNLKQIGQAAALYADDNNYSFFYIFASGAGSGFSIPNDGQWTLNPKSNVLLPPNHWFSYWAIGYWNYYGGVKEIFGCPSANTVDEWREHDRYYPKEFWKNSTYGMPDNLITPFDASVSSVPLKITSYKSPQTTILCQDSGEQKMEGPGDSLGRFPGTNQILEDWIGSPPGSGGLSRRFYDGYEFEWEWYRHDKVCNTLWVPGNVSGIKFNHYKGVDYRWYTGDEPVERPKF